MLRLSVPLALALAVALSGCAREPVQRGTNLYANGHYIEAAEVFARTENRLPSMSTTEQARYGLYRGLTLLVLGDLTRAHHWFSYARNIEQAYPGSLGQQRFALLERGSYELGNRIRPVPGQPGVSSAVATTPAAAPQPPPASEPMEKRSFVP